MASSLCKSSLGDLGICGVGAPKVTEKTTSQRKWSDGKAMYGSDLHCCTAGSQARGTSVAKCCGSGMRPCCGAVFSLYVIWWIGLVALYVLAKQSVCEWQSCMASVRLLSGLSKMCSGPCPKMCGPKMLSESVHRACSLTLKSPCMEKKAVCGMVVMMVESCSKN